MSNGLLGHNRAPCACVMNARVFGSAAQAHLCATFPFLSLFFRFPAFSASSSAFSVLFFFSRSGCSIPPGLWRPPLFLIFSTLLLLFWFLFFSFSYLFPWSTPPLLSIHTSTTRTVVAVTPSPPLFVSLPRIENTKTVFHLLSRRLLPLLRCHFLAHHNPLHRPCFSFTLINLKFNVMSTFPSNASPHGTGSSSPMDRAHHNNNNSNAAPPGTTLPSNRNQYHSKEELPVSDRLAPYRSQSHSNVSVNNDEIYILETASHDNINSPHDIDTPVYNHTTTRQGQDTFVPSSNTPSNETSLPSPTSPTDTAVPVPRKKQTHTPTPQTRWKALRLRVMRLATVRRLQLLWGLLALFGFMSWLALMPAYAFRYTNGDICTVVDT